MKYTREQCICNETEVCSVFDALLDSRFNDDGFMARSSTASYIGKRTHFYFSLYITSKTKERRKSYMYLCAGMTHTHMPANVQTSKT